MWAPDLNVQPTDAPGTATAMVPVSIGITNPTGGLLTRVRLIPYGTFQGREGVGSWTLRDKPHARDVIEATRRFQRGAPMLFDYDHQSIFSSRGNCSTAGAIEPASLSAEVDGIYANVEWTPVAQTAIARKEYRFHAAHVRAQKSSGLITRLIGAGLTNSANGEFPAMASMAASALNSVHLEIDMKLTEEERAVCSMLDIDETDFLSQKKADALERQRQENVAGKLSKEELVVCSMMGVDPSDFLATKEREAAALAPSLLTKAEQEVCASLGWDEAEFLEAKKREGR